MSDAVVPHPAEHSVPRERRVPGRWFARAVDSDVFYSFRRSRLTMVAAAITALFFLLAILAPLLAVQNPFDPSLLQLMKSTLLPYSTVFRSYRLLIGMAGQGCMEAGEQTIHVL